MKQKLFLLLDCIGVIVFLLIALAMILGAIESMRWAYELLF